MSARQRTVVDPDLIDEAPEVFAPHRIAADSKGSAARDDSSLCRAALHENSIHVHSQHRSVVGEGKVCPGVRAGHRRLRSRRGYRNAGTLISHVAHAIRVIEATTTTDPHERRSAAARATRRGTGSLPRSDGTGNG